MEIANKTLTDIQKSYFALLKDCFNEQYLKVLEVNGDTKKGILNWAKGKYEDDIVYITKRRLEDIRNFWKINLSNLDNALVSLELLPVYSVSRPMFFKNQITSSGLYCDLFICHDESISALSNFEKLPNSKLVNNSINLLKDYMDIISLESVFIPDTNPLAIICPGERDLDEQIELQIIDKGKLLTIAFANDLLGTSFTTLEELIENTNTIIGVEDIKKSIQNPDLLPAPFSEASNISERLSQCFKRLRFIQSQSLLTIPDKPILSDMLINFLTEFGVMEGQIHGSLETDSAPLLPRYTWDLYKWRISKGNMDSSKLLGWEEKYTTAVVTSFQHENLNWLSNIPLDSLIELRKMGFLEDFRQRIRSARKKLTLKEGISFDTLSIKIQKEIEMAIAEHQESILALEREAHELVGRETTKFLGKMWLAIASSVIPLLSVFGITLDVGEYGAKMSESAKLIKSIPDRLKRGPWGVLMEVKKTKDNPY
jgi:hypothetical protein